MTDFRWEVQGVEDGEGADPRVTFRDMVDELLGL